MSFASTSPLSDLRPFIFGNHALKLYQQTLLGVVTTGGFQKNRLCSTPAEFFEQQNLVGVFTAEPIRRIDKQSLNASLGHQISQPLQSGSG
jgi:hypothetical protein